MHADKKTPHSEKTIPFTAALNPAQLEAVQFQKGPLLVIAGAGSGKTRTLTYRVARLVSDGIAPSEILLLTFTRKSAREMLNRAAQLLDGRCEQVAGGTFHSFANAILRRYAKYIGFQSNFTILDRGDVEDLLSMICNDLRIRASQKGFPKRQTIASLLGRAVNKVCSLEAVVSDDYPHFKPHLESLQHIQRVFQQRKREANFLDYDDLLVYLQRLLIENPDVRRRISGAYQYIMVDEYQDTNPIQADIIRLLGSEHRNVMVVGDDAQSIYAFRGADFKNIIEFPDVFPETRIIKLEENYRSVQPILTLTNEIIRQAKEKYTKTLFTSRPGGCRPVLVDAADENSQSRFVVETLHELRRSGVPLHRMAVLFRAGFHSFDLEIELAREAIPFVKVGGFKFMESAHIKDVLAHMRLVASPYDRLSWNRVLLLLDKIGPKTALRLYEAIVAERSGFTGILTIRHKLTKSEGMQRLQGLFAELDARSLSVVEMGEAVVRYYSALAVEKFDDHPRRLRDLEQLVAIMARYQSLETFMTDIALEPPNASDRRRNLSADADSSEDRLTLSTVHSAKGLEWHTVFILWALDGRFPSIHALNDPEELEEELRLMYVAATRAQENLFFSYPMQIYDRSAGAVLSRPSRFLDGIPDELLQRRTVGI